MRTRGIIQTGFIFAVCLSLLAAAGCADKRGRTRGAAPAVALVDPPRPAPALTPLPDRPLSRRLELLRARAAEQASRGRGLAWLAPVGMTELTGWEYGTRTRELSDALVTEDLKALSRLAVAGGLLPEGTDLAALATSFTAATASAAYSPLDKRVLVVQNGPKADEARTTALLTHEYVHALQDQHFDLLGMMTARPFDFDRTEALFALVEGDAVSVERRAQGGEAFARLSPEEIARREDERYAPYREGIGALFPPLLTETFVFRYRDGLRFVEALRRAKPAVGADQIFRRPPRSSEQVLHPEKYLTDEPPREVALGADGPAGDGWRLAAETSLGEIGARGLLLSGLGAEEARRAASGWGGDRAFLFERAGGGPLFVWKTVWDTPAEAREFFRAYNTLRLKAGESEDAAGPTERRVWRDGNTATFVVLDGAGVYIARGARAEVEKLSGAATPRA